MMFCAYFRMFRILNCNVKSLICIDILLSKYLFTNTKIHTKHHVTFIRFQNIIKVGLANMFVSPLKLLTAKISTF